MNGWIEVSSTTQDAPPSPPADGRNGEGSNPQPRSPRDTPPPLVPQNDDACITFTFSPRDLKFTIVIPATEAISSVRACTSENGEYLKIRVTYRPPGTDEWAYLYAKYRMKSFIPFFESFFLLLLLLFFDKAEFVFESCSWVNYKAPCYNTLCCKTRHSVTCLQ